LQILTKLLRPNLFHPSVKKKTMRAVLDKLISNRYLKRMPQSSNKILLFVGLFIALVFFGMLSFLLYPSFLSQLKLYQQKYKISQKDAEAILHKQLPGDASKAEQDKRFSAILSLAKSTNYINIHDCKPDPLVYKTTTLKIKFKNPDTIDRYISFDKSKNYLVRNQSETIIQPLLAESKIISYGYGCDSSSKSVGFILLEKK